MRGNRTHCTRSPGSFREVIHCPKPPKSFTRRGRTREPHASLRIYGYNKCKSSLNGHHLRAERCCSGSHAGAALWAGGRGAGGPAPSPTVEMGVKQGIDMKVPATGPGHAGFSKAVQENLSPEGCAEASEEPPVR